MPCKDHKNLNDGVSGEMAGTSSPSEFSGVELTLHRAGVLIGTGIVAAGLLIGSMSSTAWAEEQSNTEGQGKSTATTRDQMLNSSVDGYAEKLRKKGGTFKEWMKLVQYYGVLGKTDKALEALALGKEDLKDDPQSVRRLERFAKMVGLKQ